MRRLIEEYAETLKVEAHQLDHGLTEQEFYNSGLFLPGLNTGVSRDVPDDAGRQGCSVAAIF